MYRAVLVGLVGCVLAFASAGLAVEDKKEKDKEKQKDKDKEKPKSKDPLDETLKIGDFDLTIGEWIKKLRTHEDPGHRRIALYALDASDKAGTSGLPALIAAIEKDKDEQVRIDAVALLGRQKIETPGAMKTLVGVLQTDKSGDVRETAAVAIGGKFLKLTPDFLIPIVEALKDEHIGTRIAVAGVLRDLGAQRDIGAKVKPALPALLDALKNPKENPQVRAAAIHALSRHGKDDPQLAPLLLDLLKNADTPLALREAAADGLGRSDSDAAAVVNALCDTLSDKKVEMRKAGAFALIALGEKAKAGWPAIKARAAYEPKTHEPVETNSAIRNHLIRLTGVLAKANSEAVVLLTEAAVHDTSTENRLSAIQELGELSSLPKETQTALAQIASDDPRASIRTAANKALKRK